ncbi:hypothetical protein [Streptomyces sp. NPDC055992]|uniref:hypothetical protein n=1 Tax=Streptomyces sp. NPDC055992 TaxID=3345673 RepID=UPI0035DAD356
MPRSQWYCLVAALAVVLGLFCGPAATMAQAPARAATAPVVTAAGHGQGIPGCGEGGKRAGGEPAVPAPARASHDQAPGLAEWGLPAAPGDRPAEVSVPMTPRGPDEAAPGPVELSVLRV